MNVSVFQNVVCNIGTWSKCIGNDNIYPNIKLVVYFIDPGNDKMCNQPENVKI